MSYCSKCGKENADGARFCASCGENLAGVLAPAASASAYSATIDSGAGEQMTFGNSIATCLSKYAVFEGRAARSEFWWFYLFTLLLNWGASLVDPTQVVSILGGFALLVPFAAAGARRLHDTNRSGWLQLLVFTIIGVIPVVIWLASEGHRQDNQYGKPVS